MENIEHRLMKMRLRWFGHVKRTDENSVLRRAMDLEVEGRRKVGRKKKTCNPGQNTLRLLINKIQSKCLFKIII